MSVFTDESDKVKLWVNLDPVLREPADSLLLLLWGHRLVGGGG